MEKFCWNRFLIWRRKDLLPVSDKVPVHFEKNVWSLRLYRVVRLGHNDRTFRSQRPHDWAAMTARFFSDKRRVSSKRIKSASRRWYRLFIFFVHPQGFEPWTHWLRVSCSTNWAKSAFRSSRGSWRIRTAVHGFADRWLSHSSKEPFPKSNRFFPIALQRYN